MKRIPRDFQILLALAVALPFLPFILSQYYTSIAILILYWAYLGLAWNIMGGYAGQFSFGHAAFYGIGAYTSTVLLVDHDVSPWLGMLAGAGLAGLYGLVIGFLSFRFGLKGHFFALATFAFAEMTRLVASEMDLINTTIGIHIPLIRGDSWSRIQFEETPRNYYFVILGLMLLGLLVTISISRSKLGYYFLAIRENEEAAAALGVNVNFYKVVAVFISASLTAMGGSFFTQYFMFVDPALAFGTAISIGVLLRPIVGGVGTVWGPLAGALLLTPLAEVTRTFVRNPPPGFGFIDDRAGVDVMLFGALLIIFVLFVPDGIVGKWQQWRKRYAQG